MPTLDYSIYAQIARLAAAESIVLLRNENGTLPLQKDETVALFGRTQYDTIYCGNGSGGLVNVPYVISLNEALTKVQPLVAEVEAAYQAWLPDHPFDEGEGWAATPWSQEEMPLPDDLIQRASTEAKKAIYIIGRTAGEDRDNVAEPGGYYLTEQELEVLQGLRKHFEQLVVIVNAGNIIDMAWSTSILPDAILYAWQGGSEAGHAMADVLTGAVTPSGHLPDTIAQRIEDYPSNPYFGEPDTTIYGEDIYVGYRYFETFAPDRVLYPFGFGLSYTDFEYACSELVVDPDGQLNLKVTVTNRGDARGKAVVQMYVSAPQGALGQPVKKLVDFGKTRTLEIGESETLELVAYAFRYGSFDDSGVTGHRNAYLLEAGTYTVCFGPDVRNTQVAGSYDLDETRVLQQVEEQLAPTEAFDRMVAREAEGKLVPVMEAAPLRETDLDQRIAQRHEGFEPVAYDASARYDFADYAADRISLEQYLSQFSDLDLIHLSRGPGMSPAGVTPGIAGGFGGVSEKLRDRGLPMMACADGPSGIRMDNGAMAFSVPNGTALAATFHPQLNEELFNFVGMELRKNHIELLLGPGTNIHRHPLNGRNFEYFSEDPLLSGLIASAQVVGLREMGAAATVKHFALNNQEFRRTDVNAVASQRAIREIYLKPFEILVKEGKLRSLMTSYNPIQGIWAASNVELVTNILRGEWGYDGLVMTDWWAKMNWAPGDEGERHKVGAMIRAQNDLYMVSRDAEHNGNEDTAEASLAEGRITRADLVRNAGNIVAFIRDYAQAYHPMDLAVEHEPQQRKGVFARVDLGSTTGEPLTQAVDLTSVKGQSMIVNFEVKDFGLYRLELNLRSQGAEVSQMNISVSVNNIPMPAVSLYGSGAFTESIDLAIFQYNNNFVELRFSEAGLQISQMDLVHAGDLPQF